VPPSDTSRKWYHDELDNTPLLPDEPDPKKKKKTRGLCSGKDQQKRRRSKAVCKGRTIGQVEGTWEDTNAARSENSQLMASSSRVRLEDLEDGEISDSVFWEDEYG
jgi:hypothetical protein